jgi:predicted dehydrogenase
MEKPIANSLAEADAMLAECRAGGTVLTIGHQRRWYNHARWVRQAIKDGAIGRPTHGYVSWPTGRIFTEGTHDFDSINFYLDDRPVEVMGTVDFAASPEMEDIDPYLVQYTQSFDPGARGFITYANGARIAIDAMRDVLKPSSFIFCGTGGRIEVAEVRAGTEDAVRGGVSDSIQRGPKRVPNVPIRGHIDYRARDGDRPDLSEEAPVTRQEPPSLPPNIAGDAERMGLREILDCIDTGAPLSSSGDDGRQALEVIVAFHMSAKAGGKPVSLPLPESALSYKLRHQGET